MTRIPGKTAIFAALAMALATLAGGTARAEGKGSMEIGLASHYNFPTLDAAEFEPNYDFGVIFHYWLNDETSLMAGFNQMTFLVPIKVQGDDDDFLYNSGVIFGGFRHRPEVDFFVSPYFELGLGYQTWQTAESPSAFDDRDGSSIAYYGGFGWDYDILHTVTLTTSFRYLHMAMEERIERKAYLNQNGGWEVDKEDLKGFGVYSAGIELTWRFK